MRWALRAVAEVLLDFGPPCLFFGGGVFAHSLFVFLEGVW